MASRTLYTDTRVKSTSGKSIRLECDINNKGETINIDLHVTDTKATQQANFEISFEDARALRDALTDAIRVAAANHYDN